MNILLVTIAFPPQNSPGALRTFSWAKYWSRAGHKVTILTTAKKYSPGALMFPNELKPYTNVKICEVAVDFRPSSSFSNIGSQKLGQNKLFEIMYKIHEFIANILGPIYDIYLPYLPLFIRAGTRLGRHEKFDIIVSTFSPATCHLVAHFLKNVWQIPWVADYRDLWSGSEFTHGIWPFPELARIIERETVRTADLMFAVSTPMQQELQRRYRIPAVTVENGFDAEDYDSLDSEKIFPIDGKLRFVYTGAVYGKRSPAPFFAALKKLIDSGQIAGESLEILFYGGRTNHVRSLADSYGLGNLVKIMGMVDHQTALRAQRDADGLLFLEGQDYAVDCVLTSKIFEYTRCGNPVLGIGMSEQSTAGQFLVKSGVGYPLGNNVEAIANFLLTHYIKNKKPPLHPDFEFINNFSREKMAYKALYYIEKIL